VGEWGCRGLGGETITYDTMVATIWGLFGGVLVQPIWMDGMTKVVGLGSNKDPSFVQYMETPHGIKVVS